MGFHESLIAQWRVLVQLSIPLWANHSIPVGLRMVLVIQETRGRYNSTGEFDFFGLSREDSTDSMAWLRQQTWSNGIVIPWGISAMGLEGLLAGDAAPHSYTPPVQNIGLIPN